MRPLNRAALRGGADPVEVKKNTGNDEASKPLLQLLARLEALDNSAQLALTPHWVLSIIRRQVFSAENFRRVIRLRQRLFSGPFRFGNWER